MIKTIIILLLTLTTIFSFGQNNSLVYRFSVDNIVNIDSAKQVQYELLKETPITSCNFIDECDCFKLTTSSFISYSDLKNILYNKGYRIYGDIFLSDGRILKETTQTNK